MFNRNLQILTGRTEVVLQQKKEPTSLANIGISGSDLHRFVIVGFAGYRVIGKIAPHQIRLRQLQPLGLARSKQFDRLVRGQNRRLLVAARQGLQAGDHQMGGTKIR